MKTYVFTVVIHEGNDEFWESATHNGNSGCDDVRLEILNSLSEHGFNCDVALTGYRSKNALADLLNLML